MSTAPQDCFAMGAARRSRAAHDPFGELALAVVAAATREAATCPRARAWLDQVRADILNDAPPHVSQRLTRDRSLF